MTLTPEEIAGQREAAAEIGELVNRILALAPEAGLYVGIKIEPASPPPSEEQ